MTISNICVDIASGLVEFNTVATILCLSKMLGLSRGASNVGFLDGYLNDWSERSARDRLSEGSVQGEDYFMFVQHMRSFVIIDTSDALAPQAPEALTGIFCKRERATLNSPEGGFLTLSERRFSACLSVLPVKSPLGSYVLLSVVDDFDLPPDKGKGVYSTSVLSGPANCWTRFGLLPADSYTGIGVFQLQLCSFIDRWEEDWNATLDAIDSLVSVNVSDPLRGL
jgi:hypothetical protein